MKQNGENGSPIATVSDTPHQENVGIFSTQTHMNLYI